MSDRIGNYRVERVLGSTATGSLYEGVHLVLPRRAVIKIAHPGRMFAVHVLREACVLEAIQGRGIPQVFESGRLEDFANAKSGEERTGYAPEHSRPWFALERIDGHTLSEQMVTGPLPPLELARLVRDVAGILAHAHKRGVVHRALRPDRIVVTRRRAGVAVPDWSDARPHDAVADHLVAPRDARAYIAPEIHVGDPADDRADVFALGVIGYQALTGTLPRGMAVRARRADIPGELATLIDQMVAFDRFDRPTAEEIRADLDWLCEALSIEHELPPPSASATLRIRRPRWTPPIDPGTDSLAPIVGEIVTDTKHRA